MEWDTFLQGCVPVQQTERIWGAALRHALRWRDTINPGPRTMGKPSQAVQKRAVLPVRSDAEGAPMTPLDYALIIAGGGIIVTLIVWWRAGLLGEMWEEI